MPNTLWARATPRVRRRPADRASPTSREFEHSDLVRRDDARWGALEVIPTKADYVLDLIRMNSLWPLLSGLACCAIEMMSAATSKNDMDRWGMFPFRASPRQADVLIVAGTLTTKMAGPLLRLWEQMPEPKWCVAMGDCTCSGGRYKRSYSTIEGIDRVMPVDVYVPGCPPRPEGLIYGMMKLQQLVKDRRGHWPERADRAHRARRTSERWTARCAQRLEARFDDRLTGPSASATTRRRSGSARPTCRGHARPARRAGARLQVPVPTSPASTPASTCRSSTTSGGDDARLAARHRRRAVPRRPARPLVTVLWPGAEWMEREAYDMFGIIFEGNRDLRRIYMPPDYTSFPLRKDFYLPDDAARSPGGGVRHMEQAHAPAQATPWRRAPDRVRA